MTEFSITRRWKNRFLQILLRCKQLLLPNRENKSERLSLTSVHVMESIPKEKDPGRERPRLFLSGHSPERSSGTYPSFLQIDH
ncbi:hypothetical protein ABNC40_03185 [Paenibacillus larvae]